jgi:O-antigen/teichoic acid export membrane protein
MAEKELRFTTLAVIEVVAASLGFVAAFIVAMLRGGVYALVAAILVSGIVSNALAWLLLSKGLRPNFVFALNEVKPYLRYGSYRLGDTLFNTIQSQADVLIGGAVVGSSAMGIYTVPRDLVQKLANSVINPVVTRVGLPVMAKVQSDKLALKSVYLQTLRMTSSVNFPVYAVLAIWANDAVAILLGPQWQHAMPLMRLFAAWGMVRSTGNPVGSLLYATGHVRRAFWWNLSQLTVVPALLWFGAHQGGIQGLAIAMLCVQLLIFYPIFSLLVRPCCDASFVEYIGELLPPLAATALAVAFGFAFSQILPDDRWLRVALAGAVTVVTYIIASRTLNRPWLHAISELIYPLLRHVK